MCAEFVSRVDRSRVIGHSLFLRRDYARSIYRLYSIDYTNLPFLHFSHAPRSSPISEVEFCLPDLDGKEEGESGCIFLIHSTDGWWIDRWGDDRAAIKFTRWAVNASNLNSGAINLTRFIRSGPGATASGLFADPRRGNVYTCINLF